MITVNFTALQCQEAAHKLCIVRDEPDLLDSYELTEEEVAPLADLFLNSYKAGRFTFDEKFADVLTGEFENAIEIARDNLDADPSYLSYIRSMANAMDKVARALCAPQPTDGAADQPTT